MAVCTSVSSGFTALTKRRERLSARPWIFILGHHGELSDDLGIIERRVG